MLAADMTISKEWGNDGYTDHLFISRRPGLLPRGGTGKGSCAFLTGWTVEFLCCTIPVSRICSHVYDYAWVCMEYIRTRTLCLVDILCVYVYVHE